MEQRVGERAPDFLLTDTTGRTFRLTDHFGHGPIVLVFNRGFA